ncbi:hypothetical protein [Mycolicibacterium fortuitum]|uniref:hypothetical protein n=1 Tax=Mycolicibacterium fortuitum TaxID=1766 RepID=UPI00261DAFE3|nr:hypothetical protein [Mycolicibacterium fortuitum]
MNDSDIEAEAEFVLTRTSDGLRKVHRIRLQEALDKYTEAISKARAVLSRNDDVKDCGSLIRCAHLLSGDSQYRAEVHYY